MPRWVGQHGGRGTNWGSVLGQGTVGGAAGVVHRWVMVGKAGRSVRWSRRWGVVGRADAMGGAAAASGCARFGMTYE